MYVLFFYAKNSLVLVNGYPNHFIPSAVIP